MIKIAVVDDSEDAVNKCRQIINSINDIKIDIIDSFDSGSSFLSVIDEKYDIVILDIDMPYFSGMDIAGFIREKGLKTILVFVTSHDALVYQT